MNETSVAQVLVGDPLAVSFPRFYAQKDFQTDARKLKDILRKQTRERLTADELAEVGELRKKLRRIDGDVAVMLVIETSLKGGYVWF